MQTIEVTLMLDSMSHKSEKEIKEIFDDLEIALIKEAKFDFVEIEISVGE